MKRNCSIIATILIVVLAAALAAACVNNTNNTEKRSISFGSDATGELVIDPEDFGGSTIAYVGGTGWNKSEYCYNYSGGEMEVEFEITAGNSPWEYGLGLVLDGVCQSVKLVADGTTSEEKPVHRVVLAANEKRTFKYSFTPTVGKAGDVLNIGILDIGTPSYLPVYTGSSSYSQFLAHSAQALSGVVVRFLADAPVQSSAAEPEIVRLDVPQEYVYQRNASIAGSGEPERAAEEYARITLFSDPPGNDASAEAETPYLLSENGNELTAYFEAFGQAQNYRITIFVDHEPVELAPGKTYFDISTDINSVVRAKLDIPLNGRTEHGCIYALIAQHIPLRDWESTRAICSENAYVCLSSTRPKFLFIGSVPEPVTPEPTTDAPSGETFAPSEETPVPLLTPPPVEKGTQLGIKKEGYASVPMLLTDDGKLVLIDNSISFFETKTPVTVYDIAEGKTISTFELPENILLTHLAGGELIAVQNPVYDHASVSIFDLSGRLLRSFELTGELGIGAEEREALKNEYSGITFDRLNDFIMLSEDGASLLHAERTVDEGGSIKAGETYLYDLKTGERRSVALRLDTIDGTPCYFDGERIAAAREDSQKGVTVVEFYSLDGSKLKELSIKASGDVYKSVCSTAGKSLLLCDNASRDDKLTGKLVLIDTEAFEISEFEAKARDSKWAKLSKDGRLILTLGGDENRAVLRLYERESGRVLREFSLENVINPWFESIACVDTANSRILVQNAVAGEDGEQEYTVTSIDY